MLALSQNTLPLLVIPSLDVSLQSNHWDYSVNNLKIIRIVSLSTIFNYTIDNSPQ